MSQWIFTLPGGAFLFSTVAAAAFLFHFGEIFEPRHLLSWILSQLTVNFLIHPRQSSYLGLNSEY